LIFEPNQTEPKVFDSVQFEYRTHNWKYFKSLRSEASTIVKNEFKTVFENNNSLSTLKLISKILCGENENNELGGDLEELSSDDKVFFKYSPIKSVDVERYFLTHKTLLIDNHWYFKFENLAKQYNSGKII